MHEKFFSMVFFILTVAAFALDLYIGIAGAIGVNNQFAAIAARGESGHALLGVGLDILVIAVILVSLVGIVFSLVSWKIAQYNAIRVASMVMFLSFFLPGFICYVILGL